MSRPVPRSASTSLRVRIVDDDRETVQTLGILLRSEGMEVRTLQSGTEALQTAETFVPDVVLLDIGMPEKNGLAIHCLGGK
jgi:DNA-binding response OmpR family regulator